jgi:hypothetical protein
VCRPVWQASGRQGASARRFDRSDSGNDRVRVGAVWSVEQSEELMPGRVHVDFYMRRETISNCSIQGI